MARGVPLQERHLGIRRRSLENVRGERLVRVVEEQRVREGEAAVERGPRPWLASRLVVVPLVRPEERRLGHGCSLRVVHIRSRHDEASVSIFR